MTEPTEPAVPAADSAHAQPYFTPDAAAPPPKYAGPGQYQQIGLYQQAEQTEQYQQAEQAEQAEQTEQYQQPGQYSPQQYYAQAHAKDWMGVVALVSSFFLPVVGVIFGHLAMTANHRGEARNRGMSFAGLLVSYTYLAAIWLLVGYLFSMIPFLGIPLGGFGLTASIVGLVLGLRMRARRTANTWSAAESTWTIAISSVMAGLSLILVTVSALFIFLWVGLANSGSNGEFGVRPPVDLYVDSTVSATSIPVATFVSGGVLPVHIMT